MNTKRIKAWAVVDPENNEILDIHLTREQARSHKRFSARAGWDFKIVKLGFVKTVR